MSTLELVLVPLGIIVGFGISEILRGWGEQIRSRRHAIDPLQIAASALILFLCLTYLWGTWLLRGLDWTFPLYLAVAAPALALSLAAHVARVDCAKGAPSPGEQYLQSHRPIYLLLTVMPLTAIGLSLVTEVRSQLDDPPDLVGVTLMRIGVVALLVALGLSDSRRFHTLALATAWLVLVGVVLRVVFRLA